MVLCGALGRPILSTSVEIEDADEVVSPASIAMHYEGRADLILDGGDGAVEPSTVVDLSDPDEPTLIRQGIAPF